MNSLAALTIFAIITFVGGFPFLIAGVFISVLLYYGKFLHVHRGDEPKLTILAGKQFGRLSREMRRLGMFLHTKNMHFN